MLMILARAIKPTVPMALVAVLVGCANPRIDDALFAQTALVGMPKQTLLSCAGVPERAATVDSIEFLTYRAGEWRFVDRGPRFGVFGGFSENRSAYGLSLGFPLTGSVGDTYGESVRCEATFTLRNGFVERIVYGGSESPHGRLNQCYAIVENCLALLRPLQPAALPPG